MPGESILTHRPGSPFNVEENAGKRDKNFRKYASGIERALSLFETALQEWADYISFLGRLLKALQASPPDVHEVPYSRLVSKRLAQCLHPSLPSGVHQKALEAYAICFSTLGRDGLAAELPMFLSGLAPLLSYASSSVKPVLLNLFDTFILDLQLEVLKPALKAIILSLLPGLDEPSSDEFTRTQDLLNRFRRTCVQTKPPGKLASEAEDDRFFWQSLFLASISNSVRRNGALVYLEHNLPSLIGTTESRGSLTAGDADIQKGALTIGDQVEAVISPEPGLLIRTFAAGLQDEQLLVQRGFLELLVTRMPLSSPVIQLRVSKSDRELLVAAAISVVLRREMSLNRRLWLWFLGQPASTERDQSEPSSPEIVGSKTGGAINQISAADHFQEYGLDSVVQGLLKAFCSSASTSTLAARPFRISLSLMDRWEIGGLILPQIFKPAMESVYGYHKSVPPTVDVQEVLKSANVFFDAIQSRLIWKQIMTMITSAFRSSAEQDACDKSSIVVSMNLISFIVRNFNVQEEEMLMIHIPNVIYVLLHYANRQFLENQDISKERTLVILGSIFDTVTLLFNELPDHIVRKVLLPSKSRDVSQSQGKNDGSQKILLQIDKFYAAEDTSSTRGNNDVSSPVLTAYFMSEVTVLVVSCMERARVLTPQLRTTLALLARLVQTSYEPHSLEMAPLLAGIDVVLHHSTWGDHLAFESLSCMLSGFEILQQAMGQEAWLSNVQVRSVTTTFVRDFWRYISPIEVQHNVDAINCLWRIHHMRPDDAALEGAVINLLYEDVCGHIHEEITQEGVRHFTTLWAQSLTPSRSPLGRSSSTSRLQPDTPGRPLGLQHNPNALGKPLILILDLLKDSASGLRPLVQGWLRSLTNLDLIYSYLIPRLHEALSPLYLDDATVNTDLKPGLRATVSGESADEVVYWLRSVTSICEIESPATKAALQSTSWGNEKSESERQYMAQLASFAPYSASDQNLTLQDHIVYLSTFILQKTQTQRFEASEALGEACLDLLRQIFAVGDPKALKADYAESVLFESLQFSVEQPNNRLQVMVMTTIKELARRMPPPTESTNMNPAESQNSEPVESKGQGENQQEFKRILSSPSSCLLLGLRSTSSYPVLEDWVDFLEVISMRHSQTFFDAAVPLIECLCQSIRSLFEDLRCSFTQGVEPRSMTSEPVQALNLLFNALEFVLSKGHGQVRLAETQRARSAEPTQGYLGNMVTGLFAGDTQGPRTGAADDRRGILLGFREALKTAYEIWAWRVDNDQSSTSQGLMSTSFQYVSIRLRNRTRRVLENLLSAEPLECLEVFIQLWKAKATDSDPVMDLLNALDATRPKYIMPAIFNSLYSRTNPSVLETYRQSTFASQLSEIEIAAFLVSYTRSMDDDALDEVWIDCMTFAKDVLANPMPQRHILPLLLEFIATLGQKIDNTNFGDMRKMRREIADLFARLLAAMFTIKPLSFSSEDSGIQQETTTSLDEKHEERVISTDIVSILNEVLPQMMKILIDTDRLSATASTVSMQILMPSFHWKGFPRNINQSTVELMQTFCRVKEISKIWKKDVAEAFNDPKFFTSQSLDIVESGWMPLLRQWTLSDGDRMPELISRLAIPTSAGIMFGVGASSARREADRKSQVNLRRIALLLLSADNDFFVPSSKLLQDKLADLLNATATSSPSSTTRAEIYMVLRALFLKISPVHLTFLWPIVNAELHDALASIGRIASRETYTITSIIQAAKLLDTLLLLEPDEFQLREWLFVTDTVEAVYRPATWKPVALIDELVEVLDHDGSVTPSGAAVKTINTTTGQRQPLLQWKQIHKVPRENLLEQILKPFLRQLSIQTFESMYAMVAPDIKSCREELLRDLFDDSTLD